MEREPRVAMVEWGDRGPTFFSLTLEPEGEAEDPEARIARLELELLVDGQPRDQRVERQDVPGAGFEVDLPLDPEVAQRGAALAVTARVAASPGSRWSGEAALLFGDEARWRVDIALTVDESGGALWEQLLVTRPPQRVGGVAAGPTWRDLARMVGEDEEDAADAPELGHDEHADRALDEGAPTIPRDAKVYRVWYATDRKPTTVDGEFVGYDKGRDDRTHYGACDVVIPKWHKVGETESGLWERLRGRDGTLRIQRISAMEPEWYWDALAAQVRKAPGDVKHAVVFIHGYRVKFREAVIRAAQLGIDLKINGAMAVFAWPADGRVVLGYTHDESAIEGSELRIGQYLEDFAMRSGADAVHVIAHSMGNRPLLRSVERIVLRAQAAQPRVLFGQIVLAAPDVTPSLFTQLASAYRQVSRRTTLYVSARDRALELSELLHGAPRVGDGEQNVMVVDACDTVVATAVDQSFLGHGYVAEAREVITDVHALIHHDAPPDTRMGLERVETETGCYWIIRE